MENLLHRNEKMLAILEGTECRGYQVQRVNTLAKKRLLFLSTPYGLLHLFNDRNNKAI